MNKTFMYGEITGDILKCSFEVYNVLGGGFMEHVYENALAYELKRLGHEVEGQKLVEVYYRGYIIGEYRADLVVDEKVIIELKVSNTVESVHKSQLLNYLRASEKQLGMVVCFGEDLVRYKRVVNTVDFKSDAV